MPFTTLGVNSRSAKFMVTHHAAILNLQLPLRLNPDLTRFYADGTSVPLPKYSLHFIVCLKVEIGDRWKLKIPLDIMPVWDKMVKVVEVYRNALTCNL